MKKSREKTVKLTLRKEAILHLTNAQLIRVAAAYGSGGPGCRTGSYDVTDCTSTGA